MNLHPIKGHSPQPCASASSATGAYFITAIIPVVDSLSILVCAGVARASSRGAVVVVIACERCKMRIVIDAMGSDTCPKPDVAGAVLAARELGHTIILVGDRQRIEAELSLHKTKGLSIEVAHAGQQIVMADSPTRVAKEKPQSSMQIGMQLVSSGAADAFVTAGNTGAALAIATLHTLNRIPGVRRPALAGIYTIRGQRIMLLDLGANTDSRPEWLVQFAVMGDIYARRVLGLAQPRVALLSNGEEEGKGNTAIREAALLLQRSRMSFVGNVEPREIVRGKADVVVSDGFVGNVFLKTFEASASYLAEAIRREIKRDLLSMVGGLLMQPAFKRVRRQTDTSEIGGAPLLGVNGVVIVGHGRSNARAIRNAAEQAALAVEGRVVELIREEFSGLQNASGDK